MTSTDPRESPRALFAIHLKHQRKLHKMSQEKVAQVVHCAPSLISAYENDCDRTPNEKIAKALDARFGLPPLFEVIQRDIVAEIGLPAGLPELIDAEGEATVIHMYDEFVVHGLFQALGYARSIIQAGPEKDKHELRLAHRVERQQVLERENPPMVVALIDEYALRRRFGGKEAMREQYEQLLKLMRYPKVAFHVVPADSGVCPEGKFFLFEVPDSQAPGNQHLAYEESATGRGRMIEDGDHVTELKVLFEQLRNQALSAPDTEQMIRNLLLENQ